MNDTRRSPGLTITGAILLVMGLGLLGAGIWLIALRGSWFYAFAGLLMGGSGWLLIRARAGALVLYAILVLSTLLWSLWEAGLDWWPLAARGDIIFVVGLLLLMPWVLKNLRTPFRMPTISARQSYGGVTANTGTPIAAQQSGLRPLHGAALPLTASLALFLAVAVASWFVQPHDVLGKLPRATAPSGTVAGNATGATTGTAAVGAGASPNTVNPSSMAQQDGEWQAYGRTGAGQRYSPLSQITPANAGALTQAWRYDTGDVRGRPGDPEETTFEVTPLKIGNRLFLCTPHQSVIALDATTGAEIWRYDPKIQDKLALQHLTCRGLAYSPGAGLSPLSGLAAPSGTGAAGSPTAGSSTTGNAMAGTPMSAPASGMTATPAAANNGAQSRGVAPSGKAPANQPVAAQDNKKHARCNARLFMPTADGRIIALNPDDGAVCTNFGGGTGQINLWDRMPNVSAGSYYSTSPPVIAGGLMIVGGTVLDNVSTKETSGVIRAFDVETGRLVWNWDAGNPADTTPLAAGKTYTPNSPNSWSISSVDENLGMVYVPMGNQPPDQWGAKRSESSARYSSSVVALDLATGQVRWFFQTVHHDLWDYDVPAQPSLIDLTINGQTVPALVQPTKQGELFVLDRRNGNPILPVTERTAPKGGVKDDRVAPTQPKSKLSFDPAPLRGADMWGVTLFDQLACRIAFHRLQYDGRFTPPSLKGSLIYPGNFGVFNWGGIAVDPQRQVAFTTPTYLAFTSTLVPREDDTTLYVQKTKPEGSLPALNENFGAPYAIKLAPFVSPLGLPCQAPPWGMIAGADLTDGTIAWRRVNGTVRDSSPLPVPFKMGVPNLGGPIMTAGGVAFLTGTLDYYIRAYDVTDGRQLWESRLPAGGQATPMTYTGADGRQYVLAIAGGHGSLGTRTGDSIIAYALPK